MTTFLEYLAEKLMGPSELHKGEPRWNCPKCGHRGFHVRPHKPPHKDRCSCWTCGWWGDEHDLLAHFRPRLDYGRRLDRLDTLRQEYEASAAESAYHHPGPGNRRFAIAEAWAQIDRTLHNWEASNAHALQTMKMVVEVCREKKVNVEDVVAYADGVEMLRAVVGSYDAAWDRTAKANGKSRVRERAHGTATGDN